MPAEGFEYEGEYTNNDGEDDEVVRLESKPVA